MKNLGIVLAVLLALVVGVMSGRLSVRTVEATGNSDGGVMWEQTADGIQLTAQESDVAMAYVAMPVERTGQWIELKGAQVFSGRTPLTLEPDKDFVLGQIELLGYSCGDDCAPCTGGTGKIRPVPKGGVMDILPGPRPICRNGTDCPCPKPPGKFFGSIREDISGPPDDPAIDPTPN